MNELEDDLKEAVDSVATDVQDKVQRRAARRLVAINAVVLARRHAGREKTDFSQADADAIMTIMELLDRVSEHPTAHLSRKIP